MDNKSLAHSEPAEAIPDFLLGNDAGAPDRRANFGQKYFDDALAEAKSAPLRIRGNASCTPIIGKYLRAWRPRHLWVDDIVAAAPRGIAGVSGEDLRVQHPGSAPTIGILSAKTLRLTLKNFDPYNRNALIALLNLRHNDLERHPNWII